MTGTRAAALWAFVAVLAEAGAGCGLGSQSFELRGQVLGIDTTRNEVLLKHDDVPGLMSAMTMPFRARQRELLDGLRVGDLVKAQLVLRGADAYLTSLERVGSAPIDTEASANPAAGGFDELEPGELVPAQRFVDQSGRPRTFSAWHGRAVAVTFIYTRCPMPTFCPLMDRQFAAMQRLINANASLRRQLHLVSITFDPQHDTPGVLTEHAKQLDADPAVWTFLTGEQDAIDRFAARFGVSVTRKGEDASGIIHNLRTAIIDKDGKLVKIYSGVDWTPQQVIHDLETIAAG
jgi:protein SCO1/2